MNGTERQRRHSLRQSLIVKASLACLGVFLFSVHGPAGHTPDSQPVGKRKNEYVDAVTRGAGFMPWQERGISEAETAFRSRIEKRKDEILSARIPIEHPVMLITSEIERARRNIESYGWARTWFQKEREIADYIVEQPEQFVEKMIPELTATNTYGFTCPNCVGEKSQEGAGTSLVVWDYRQPDVIRCRRCGQTYPDRAYPETATLVCPRTGQEFTYYLNDEERRHLDDRSGRYAWHWVGKPIHVSFSGLIRERKTRFMITGVKSLALAYRLTGKPKYAETTVRILIRLAHCYRNWLYHDYWDTIADCDPMYAAWHDRELPLEWKRHLCAEAFERDDFERAGMLQNYWGAGRFHPSTDSVSILANLCLAYDSVYGARDSQGVPLWTLDERNKVERDLLLEWIIGAEPFVGGPNQANNANNKAPRVYNAQAAIAKCLGLPQMADTALRGFRAVRDRSFTYDGFSTESPSYTNMYLTQLLVIPETLYGFRRPEAYPDGGSVVDLYETDERLRLMYRAVMDQLRPDGRYLPLADTNEMASPSASIVELGLKRYPEYFEGKLPKNLEAREFGEYALFHLDPSKTNTENEFNPPEILYPAWMTSILRHGTGPKASVLSLTFSPAGGHRHYDNLALFYADSGATILGDHGYVGDMPVNSWIKSTRSHNLVVVDDEEQRFSGDHPRRPRLNIMATSPHVSLVEASSDAYRQCDDYRRLVVLVKGPDAQTFAVDIFRVRGGDKHSYRVFSEIASSDVESSKLLFSGVPMAEEKALPEIGESLKREDIFGLRDIRTAETPPPHWQAIWSEPERQYRLWILTQANRVEASNGPGQRTLREAGRRVRYVDVIREEPNADSTFVAVHEPSVLNRAMPVRRVTRLETPEYAGPSAVALLVESDWGTYTFLNEFTREANVGGVLFEGRFGLLCDTHDGKRWLFTLGARTLQHLDYGFSHKTAYWVGDVQENTSDRIVASTPKPADWPHVSPGFQSYLVAHDGNYVTGFPIEYAERFNIRTGRFPLPQLKQFEIPALRFMELSK